MFRAVGVDNTKKNIEEDGEGDENKTFFSGLLDGELSSHPLDTIELTLTP